MRRDSGSGSSGLATTLHVRMTDGRTDGRIIHPQSSNITASQPAYACRLALTMPSTSHLSRLSDTVTHIFLTLLPLTTCIVTLLPSPSIIIIKYKPIILTSLVTVPSPSPATNNKQSQAQRLDHLHPPPSKSTKKKTNPMPNQTNE